MFELSPQEAKVPLTQTLRLDTSRNPLAGNTSLCRTKLSTSNHLRGPEATSRCLTIRVPKASLSETSRAKFFALLSARKVNEWLSQMGNLPCPLLWQGLTLCQAVFLGINLHSVSVCPGHPQTPLCRQWPETILIFLISGLLATPTHADSGNYGVCK